MGNRAVITTINAKNSEYGVKTSDELGVYLHWNGGRGSVQAFLKYCKLKGYRTPESDSYGWARLCQIIANFFGGGLSVGINCCRRLDCDNWDNGVYLIKNWEIVDRAYFDGEEQDSYDLNDMLEEIDKRQPQDEQFGKDYWRAEDVDVSELEVGDKVYIMGHGHVGEWEEVVGIAKDKTVYRNGKLETMDVPYIAKYGSLVDDPKDNSNNFLEEETYKRIRI